MGGIDTIALGGGCHWCTEAVFQSLTGVVKVEQGYVASLGAAATFSEAVIVHFDTRVIELRVLVEVHLLTHKSTSNHSRRAAYRSAIYVYNDEQAREVENILVNLQKDFSERLITQVLPFQEFKASREEIQNYYQKNPDAPFCERYIAPKLQLLLEQFGEFVKE